jgi:hypothetical protein
MKSTTSLLAYPQLIAEIHRLSQEGQSGTIFITSNDGHLARIVLNKGDITSLIFDSKYRGHDAIPLLLTINSARIQFADGIFDRDQKIPLPSTKEIFHQLDENLHHREREKPLSTPKFSEVVEYIRKALATHIGPVALIVCEEYLQNVGLIKSLDDAFAMIDALAPEIKHPEEEQAFKAKLKMEIVEKGLIE